MRPCGMTELHGYLCNVVHIWSTDASTLCSKIGSEMFPRHHLQEALLELVRQFHLSFFVIVHGRTIVGISTWLLCVFRSGSSRVLSNLLLT